MCCLHVKYPLPPGDNPIAVNKYYSYIIIICHISMNLEFSPQIFKIFSNIKLHEIPSSWIRIIPKEWQKDNALMSAIRQLNRLNRAYFPLY